MVRKKISPLKAEVKNKDNDVDNESQKNKTRKSVLTRRKQKLGIVMQNSGQVISMTRRMYKEIKTLQRNTSLLIPKLPFARVVREIMMEVGSSDLRIQVEALHAIQEACEMFVVQFFEDAYLCSLHGKRKTLMLMDMRLVRMIRGRQDIINH